MPPASAQRPRLFSPSAQARRLFITRGVIGGSRFWLVVGGSMMAGRVMRRSFGKRPEIVLTEKLRPGHPIRLEAIPQSSRRQRRRAAR